MKKARLTGTRIVLILKQAAPVQPFLITSNASTIPGCNAESTPRSKPSRP